MPVRHITFLFFGKQKLKKVIILWNQDYLYSRLFLMVLIEFSCAFLSLHGELYIILLWFPASHSLPFYFNIPQRRLIVSKQSAILYTHTHESNLFPFATNKLYFFSPVFAPHVYYFAAISHGNQVVAFLPFFLLYIRVGLFFQLVFKNIHCI